MLAVYGPKFVVASISLVTGIAILTVPHRSKSSAAMMTLLFSILTEIGIRVEPRCAWGKLCIRQPRGI
ncbi:hypothetical protein BDZ91DRAFT_722751 [Kalaharituber pfeilii]|nr:hypothetical protein BDZ91DRAFT_722751 [Kalaharituber pfeilii]